MTRQRDIRRVLNVCTSCGDEYAEAGHTRCKKCRSRWLPGPKVIERVFNRFARTNWRRHDDD